MGFFYRNTRDEHLSEDLVQETLCGCIETVGTIFHEAVQRLPLSNCPESSDRSFSTIGS